MAQFGVFRWLGGGFLVERNRRIVGWWTGFFAEKKIRERSLHLVEYSIGDGFMANCALEFEARDRTLNDQAGGEGDAECEKQECPANPIHRLTPEPIAFTTNRLDESVLGCAQLLSKLCDMHVDTSGLDAVGIRKSPDFREEKSATQDATLLADENIQEFQVPCGQFDRVCALRSDALLGLDRPRAEQEGCRRFRFPGFQSQRLELYRKAASRLVEEGKAYPCYCTPETALYRASF